MSIENIKTLIDSKKETFFNKSENRLLNKIIKEQSNFIIFLTDFLLITIVPVIFSLVLGFILLNFIENETKSFLIGLLPLPLFCFLGGLSMKRRTEKFIRRQIEENGDFKKEFFDSNILPYFLKLKIDSEMDDTLKLNLSLDQYKAFKLKSSPNITYGDVYKFIDTIEHTNKVLKEIEAEKYSVEYDNIKKEIQLI